MNAMRSLIFSMLALAAVPLAHAQVSISGVISGQVAPGVYGQVVIGGGPPPPVVYAQPVVAQPPPVFVGAPPVEPIYLHVPPGHAKHWDKHCHEYNACNRPVYFVRSAEYDEPKHHKHHNKHDDDD
jgi:hypothetical protein